MASSSSSSLHRNLSLPKLYEDIQSVKRTIAELRQHDEIESPQVESRYERPDSPRPAASVSLGQGKEEPVEATPWDRIGDPENPMNWPSTKKIAHFMSAALLCLIVTAGSSIITPGTLEIAVEFKVSQTAALLSLSLFVIGLALGPAIAAPISESKGRKFVYLMTFPIHMLFILGAGFSKSFGGLLACRFFAATFGAPCLAVAAGTVADLYRPHEMGAPGAIVVMTPFLGPCVGPTIGGFATYYRGWRGTQ